MSPLNVPLRFERIFLYRIWGGRALARSAAEGGLELALPGEDSEQLASASAPGPPVGETWELVDREDVNSRVVDEPAMGAFAGRRLDELMAAHASDLLGAAKPSASGRFPLLIKFIDAAKHLSVQVHPSDATLAALPADRGFEAKTEAWLIVSSEDHGRIFYGFREGVDRAAFEADVRQGVPLTAHLGEHVPAPGECFFVPGGTVHAIGAGVVLLEVQQNSDTTFRVNDWGRVDVDGQPRELHVDEALAVLDFGASPAPVRGVADGELVACEHFAMGAVQLEAGEQRAFSTQDADPRGVPRTLALVAGGATLTTHHGTQALALGDVWLCPAALGEFTLAATEPATRLVLMDAVPS